MDKSKIPAKESVWPQKKFNIEGIEKIFETIVNSLNSSNPIFSFVFPPDSCSEKDLHLLAQVFGGTGWNVRIINNNLFLGVSLS